MTSEIKAYNSRQIPKYEAICTFLATEISKAIPASNAKVWHAHPAWFLEENPIVGYSVLKAGVKLMFWSGRSFEEPELTGTSRFKDASIYYTDINQIDTQKLAQWLEKAKEIQWDYKNIVKRKGVLEPLKGL
jgi:hypothetical protein